MLKGTAPNAQTAMLASLPPLKYRKQDRPTERNSNIISELDQKEEKGKQIKCFIVLYNMASSDCEKV